jgi:hypothetical protein
MGPCPGGVRGSLLCATTLCCCGGGANGGPASGAVPDAGCASASSCLDESTALFVSPFGDDAAVGSRARPLLTLGAALARVSGARRTVIACEGTYLEDVTIRSGPVSVLGGVRCDWSPAPVRPVFGATSNAFRVIGAKGVVVADAILDAKDAIDASASSVALFVTDGEVTLRDVALQAGTGAKGRDGSGSVNAFPNAFAKNGSGTTGGAATTLTCSNGSSVGGKGGDLSQAGASGTPLGTNNGGAATTCASGGAGAQGVAGAPGPAGAEATKPGELTADGWSPQGGGDGAPGSPGQGGGGGYGGASTPSAGGGGGPGGCGGAGGGGGHGGGASVALLARASTITVSTSALVAKDGGYGGASSPGQKGQTGFQGGFAVGVGCAGGAGGAGGDGGAGGGAAGGVSVGVLSQSSTVTIDAKTTIVFGRGGDGGLTGQGPSRGIAGAAQARLELP